MDLEALISKFGYLAVFLGSAFEGETVVALGGLAAHRGYLDLSRVIAVAFVATLLADQAYFHLGRRYGRALLERRPRWRPRIERILALLERHDWLVILGFRFVYGFRTVTPFALGLSRTNAVKFLVLNVAAAALWAAVVASAGYLLAEALHRILGDIGRYEKEAFLFVALAGAGIWLFHLVTRWRGKGRT